MGVSDSFDCVGRNVCHCVFVFFLWLYLIIPCMHGGKSYSHVLKAWCGLGDQHTACIKRLTCFRTIKELSVWSRIGKVVQLMRVIAGSNGSGEDPMFSAAS